MNTVVSVASLASASAVASPSIAHEESDRELATLADRFEDLYRRWRQVDHRHAVLGAEAHTRAEVRAGIDPGHEFLPGEAELYLKHLEVTQAENGFAAVDKEIITLHREADELTKLISRLPCRTIEGFRAKVLMAVFAHDDLWAASQPPDRWEDEMTLQMLRSAVALTGAKIPEGIALPDEVDLREEDEAIGSSAKAARIPAAMDSERYALLAGYSEWLHMERRLLCAEMYPALGGRADAFIPHTGMSAYHIPHDADWRDQPTPSTRAASVLSCVGAAKLVKRGRKARALYTSHHPVAA